MTEKHSLTEKRSLDTFIKLSEEFITTTSEKFL